MTPETKPCACGRPGCLSVQRRTESRPSFRARKYASYACAMWTRIRTDRRFIDARRQSYEALVAAGKMDGDVSAGALVTPVEWLDRPSARIRLQRQAEGIVL